MLLDVVVNHIDVYCDAEDVYMADMATGELSGKAIYLSEVFDWVVVKDANSVCLVPLKKEE